MRRSTLALGAVAVFSLLGTRPAGGQEPTRSTLEIRTPLHLLGFGGMLVVSAVETKETAPAIDIEVQFFDAHDRLVKRVSRDFGPGRPLIVSVKRSELRSPEPFASVRAVAKVSRPGAFGDNHAAVQFELVDKGASVGCGGGCSICPTCGPPQPGRVDYNCVGGLISIFTVE